MQGRKKNPAHKYRQNNGFRSKVHHWQQHVESANLDKFPLTKKWHDINTASLCDIIGKHLKTLEEKLSFYSSLLALTGLGTHIIQHQLLERI